MKKLLLLIFCAFLISLTACNDVSAVKPQTQNLAFTVESKFNNTDYLLTATTDSDGKLSLTVNLPENIKNLKLLFKEDSVRFNYLELEKEIPLQSLEENSLFRILYEGFNNCATPQFENDEYFTEFKVGNEKFGFYFAESGLPICIKNSDTEIYFKGVTILK